VSILSKSYKRIGVIIEAVLDLLVEEAEPQNPSDFTKPTVTDPKINMRHLLGYLN
jgi:hypothetical protein